VLRVLLRRWGPLLTFVFDRGSASGRLSGSARLGQSARQRAGLFVFLPLSACRPRSRPLRSFLPDIRRWQIETSFRSGNCELALESPRLWSLDNRLKLLGIVLRVAACLLFLLEGVHAERVHPLLRSVLPPHRQALSTSSRSPLPAALGALSPVE